MVSWYIEYMRNIISVAALIALTACNAGSESSKSSKAASDEVVHVCVNPISFGLTCTTIGQNELGTHVQLCTTGEHGSDIGTVSQLKEWVDNKAGFIDGASRIQVATGSINNDVLNFFTEEQLEGFTENEDGTYHGIYLTSNDPDRAFLDDSCQ